MIKIAKAAVAFFKGQEPWLQSKLRVENLITVFFGKQIAYLGGLPMHASIPVMRFCRFKGLIVADLSVDGFQKRGYCRKMDLMGLCQNQRVRRLPNEE